MATTNGFVAAPEPHFASLTMQNFSRNYESKTVAKKQSTVAIRDMLGTSSAKPVGSASTSELARSGNAPHFFK